MRKKWRRQLALGLAVVTIWTSGNKEHFYAGQKDCETPAISTERLADTEQKINLDKVNYQVKKSEYAPVFDASYYAMNNEDLKIAFGNDENALFQHFLDYGMSEGRQASAEFNVMSYRNAYADLQQAFGNDLKSYYLHYMNFGKKEGRKAAGVTTLQNPVTVYNGVNYSSVYNYNYYISKNPDVAMAFPDDDISTLAHFVNYGMAEGRQASTDFILGVYKSNYSDLRDAFGNDNKSYYLHYIDYGKKEGRNAVTKIGTSTKPEPNPEPSPAPSPEPEEWELPIVSATK